ncbi:MAG: ABC transporter permease [Pseudomonadota bacterium]
MTTIIASYYKEFILFVRDRSGLAILLLMPVCLVAVMSLVQDSAWNASNASGLEVLFLDRDQGPLGLELKKGLAGAPGAKLLTRLDGRDLTEETVKQALAAGDYRFAVVVPPGASAAVIRRADEIVAAILAEQPAKPGPVAASVKLLLGPDLKGPLREAFVEKITLASHTLEVEMILNAVLSRIRKILPARLQGKGDYILGELGEEYTPPPGGLLGIEAWPSREESLLLFVSVQHNVPAWTLFAMFFIAIPLSGGIIRERNDGTLARLMTMSAPLWKMVLGRILFFLTVCFAQFGLLLLMGFFVLPLFGLPVLQTGPSPGAAALTALAAALAATGFGLMVGALFSAPEKAAIFSAVGIVISSAVGGIMAPSFIMPQALRIAGLLSPLGWGAEAFNELFVKGGGFVDVWKYCLLLLAFAMICLMVSAWKARSFFSPR